MGIKILEFKKVDKGNLYGFCNVKIDAWHMEIRSISVFCKAGEFSFALPSKQYDKPDGSKGYFAFIKLHDAAYGKLQIALREALNKYLQEMGAAPRELPEEDGGLPF